MSNAKMFDRIETINITSDIADPSDDDIDIDLDMDVEIIEESNEDLANAKKEHGNKLYKMKNYAGALQCYTDAINFCPTCAAYYGNRAAAYMMLSYYGKALEDARRSVQLDSSFVKGHLREGKCHLTLGNTAAAFTSYKKVLDLEPANSQALNELQITRNVQEHEMHTERDLQEKDGDFRRALFRMNQCLDVSPNCVKFKVKKAEALCLLERYEESQSETADILIRDGGEVDALFIRGTCLYYQDNIEKAFLHFQQVLRLAPDHNKALDIYKKAKQLLSKKESGNSAFRAGRLQEAYQLYTDALEIDKRNKFTNSKLYFNRATVCSKTSQVDQSIEDCTKAIELDSTYLKAYLRRAKSYQENEKYQEAVWDYEKICKMDKSREYKKLLQDAKIALKRSKRKDYYKILGISQQACDDEIKKAYKRRALIHHPDRHAHAGEKVRKDEEIKFKELGEAYSVVSDSKKRMRYDQGHDLEDMDGGGSFFHEFDPNQIFQTFFTNGGGGGGGGFHFTTNMPGDYTFQYG